jgi:hypothetical protein
MSTNDPTSSEPVHEPIPAAPPTEAERILSSPPGAGDLEALLADRPSRRSRVTSTTILAAVVVLAVGFLGGLLIGRNTASGSSNASGRFPNGFPSAFPSGGAFAGGNGAGGFTAGTITRIDGDTLYVKTAEGSTVKVVVGSSTSIQISKDGSLSDLSKGSPVVVQGTRTGGVLRATRISEGDLGAGGPGGGPMSSPSGG